MREFGQVSPAAPRCSGARPRPAGEGGFVVSELGGSQISTLLETLPGIANVLRSPVADALGNVIRAAARLTEFNIQDADELVRYATRRGLLRVTGSWSKCTRPSSGAPTRPPSGTGLTRPRPAPRQGR